MTEKKYCINMRIISGAVGDRLRCGTRMDFLITLSDRATGIKRHAEQKIKEGKEN